MTEDQIERRVEKATDRIDARFMADGSTMTQAEYDAEISALDNWAQQQYTLASKFCAICGEYAHPRQRCA